MKQHVLHMRQSILKTPLRLTDVRISKLPCSCEFEALFDFGLGLDVPGHLACVKLLVNEGADLQQCGLMKDTALTRAAHNGHMQVCILLKGAAVDSCHNSDSEAYLVF